MEEADPDILLAASQYSMIHHEEDLNELFPKCAERGISVVVGSPFDAGFLAGKDRFLYWGTIPLGYKEKLAGIQKVAANHHVDVRTAALQFCAAPEVVSAVIPGSHTPQQARENAESFFKAKIPASFWEELKREKLIAENAPIPKG
ncbi:aldo/keto reductase [Niastella yeongjuensis]|uniref:aldo/keto reductase n=1 Tax=Niastella yeongjuensis TaxID=354355 RepID=UPI0021D1AD96|nr:aldo/keto reductase [Niastella yeongjuensis]